MASSNSTSERKILKVKPTVFPLGFAIARVADSLIVIDFIDNLNDQTTIIESVALPLEKAEQLSKALLEAIEDAESEE